MKGDSSGLIKWVLFFAIGCIVISLDQGSKLWVLENMRLGQSIPVFEGFLNWTYVHNPGAAFGFLGNTSESFRSVFFVAMPPIAGLFILLILHLTSPKELSQVISLGAVFGGAMGNFVDRARFRHVIDFVDIHYQGSWSWPAFNVADIAIVIGVLVLIYQILTSKEIKSE